MVKAERDIAFGKKAAATHGRFLRFYSIRVGGPMGTVVEGANPGDRLTGTCDRCGTAISNVFVFTCPGQASEMHVGIDCAATRMGMPYGEVKKARAAIRDARKAAEARVRNAERAAKRAEMEVVWAAERAARLAENEVEVAELTALAADPNATEWEVKAIKWQVEAIARGWDRNEAQLEVIRERLAMCGSSRHQPGKRREMTLRVYRAPLRFEGTYGFRPTVTHVNFLTDDQGNAYVYKGTHWCGEIGATVRAKFTPGEADVRGGLTATVLSRPAFVEEVKAEDAEETATV